MAARAETRTGSRPAARRPGPALVGTRSKTLAQAASSARHRATGADSSADRRPGIGMAVRDVSFLSSSAGHLSAGLTTPRMKSARLPTSARSTRSGLRHRRGKGNEAGALVDDSALVNPECVTEAVAAVLGDRPRLNPDQDMGAPINLRSSGGNGAEPSTMPDLERRGERQDGKRPRPATQAVPPVRQAAPGGRPTDAGLSRRSFADVLLGDRFRSASRRVRPARRPTRAHRFHLRRFHMR